MECIFFVLYRESCTSAFNHLTHSTLLKMHCLWMIWTSALEWFQPYMVIHPSMVTWQLRVRSSSSLLCLNLAVDILCQTINLSQNIMWSSANPSINMQHKHTGQSVVHGRKKTLDATLAKNTDMLHLFLTDATERGLPLFFHAWEALAALVMLVRWKSHNPSHKSA